ncbi:hypothetical protein HYW99_04515 [Candidatus Woesearchaeota archaeon]|nr:hypothetical protein [Candidatus Woesearchaeota archaeon]
MIRQIARNYGEELQKEPSLIQDHIFFETLYRLAKNQLKLEFTLKQVYGSDFYQLSQKYSFASKILANLKDTASKYYSKLTL